MRARDTEVSYLRGLHRKDTIMTFKTVALITSIVTLVFGVGYIFGGELIIGRWQIQISEGVVLMGRRIGAVYLGLSAMFFLARSAEVSVSRTAMTIGTAIALSLLVVVGVSEFIVGHVGADRRDRVIARK
jgi:hypothetical protein